VVDPYLPGQADCWGMAGEPIEEIRVNTTTRQYMVGLRAAITAPLNAPLYLSYAQESYNRIDYIAEHVVPFVADALVSYKRDAVLGWCGAKRTLLQRFAAAWQSMGFAMPIMVASEARWLGPELPGGCIWTDDAKLVSQCNVLLFDWGKPDDAPNRDDWQFDADPSDYHGRSMLSTHRLGRTCEATCRTRHSTPIRLRKRR
jgi:hypothetical protein